MSSSSRSATWKGLWGWLPGVFVSLLAIWLLLRLVSWQQLVTAIRTMNLNVLPLAILFYLLGMLARCVAWQALLQRRATYQRVVFTINEGYLLNNIFPLRLGELGRAFLMGRSTGMGILQVLSTIVIERAFDVAISAGLLLATLPFALQMEWARPLAWIILGVILAGLLGLHLMVRFRGPLQMRLSSWGSRWPKLSRWALPKIQSLLEGFAALTNPRLFLISLGAMLISWTFAITEDWVLLRGVVPQAPYWWGAFVIGITALGAAVPSSSGAVGVLEAAVVGALVILKVDPSTALAYGIVLHLIHFVLSSTIGMIGLVRDGENLSRIYRELRFRKQSSSVD